MMSNQTNLIDLVRTAPLSEQEKNYLQKNIEAVDRKITWINKGGIVELKYPYVFWFDPILSFYYQYRRVMRSDPSTFVKFVELLEKDYEKIRSRRYAADESFGYYDNFLRPYFNQVQSNPYAFSDDTRIASQLQLIAKALDLVSDKIVEVERLEREESVNNEKKRTRNLELERSLRVRRLAIRAAKSGNVRYDKAAESQ